MKESTMVSERIKKLIDSFRYGRYKKQHFCDRCGKKMYVPRKRYDRRNYIEHSNRFCFGSGSGTIALQEVTNDLMIIKEKFAREYLFKLNRWLFNAGDSEPARYGSLKRIKKRLIDIAEFNPKADSNVDDSCLLENDVWL